LEIIPVLTRIYANNFRCLVAFEIKLDAFCVLCGPNGAGKSAVFDSVAMLRDLATGEALLGGEGPRDIRQLDLTAWLDSSVQEFEIDVRTSGHTLSYVVHMEQVTREHKPRIIHEQATCDGRILYTRDLEGVSFTRPDGSKTGFPLDWRQAALGAIQPAGSRREIELLQQALASMVVIKPSPLLMAGESKSESSTPIGHMENLLSWYRHLYKDQEWADSLRESLQEVWPDFRFFRLVDVGLDTKALSLRFDMPGRKGDDSLLFHQLSDGERQLIGLYMIRAALDTGAVETVLIDEPDNYVGLPELQPWVVALKELLDDEHQAILISHHPEILGSGDESQGRYLWRDNHASPTRSGPLKIPAGLSAAEAVARGWVDG
jgi:energy-coupling factor transporter ATP-binding protein EcfA2